MIQVVRGIIEVIERERWNEMDFCLYDICFCNKILDCANAPDFCHYIYMLCLDNQPVRMDLLIVMGHFGLDQALFIRLLQTELLLLLV